MTKNTNNATERKWCTIALTAYAFTTWAVISLLCNRHATRASATLVIEQPLDRFADDIKAFEKDDIDNPKKDVGLLFIGSSTFAHVSSALQEKFENFHPLVRAFGGSTIPEINNYIEETVLKYQPARICFYAGTNDIADGHSGERVFDDFEKFASIVHARLPATKIYFISMSMAPSRVRWHAQYSVGNRLVRKFARQSSFVRYIDVTHVMYDFWGNLRTSWFLDDQLHMNNLGYNAWWPIIMRALRS